MISTDDDDGLDRFRLLFALFFARACRKPEVGASGTGASDCCRCDVAIYGMLVLEAVKR